MVNMSAKFDKEEHNGLVSCSQGPSLTHTTTRVGLNHDNITTYPLCKVLREDKNQI